MKSSQFEAKTFGVGELISQRKLFRVPLHQRSFAWDKESVEEFLTDIETAYANGASDYFIGLIVIQASPSGEWVLLDGQQRLTTVSLIYAAIRSWLTKSGYDADAQQIHHEYLGVRRLGGDFSSRMLLNQENQAIFEVSATGALSDEELRRKAALVPKTSSNKLILNAAIACRKWIRTFAGDEFQAVDLDQVSKVYGLARFLDSRLKVVAVEVSSDVDAYVLFESLNDRGVALSALDLIKNYIFSQAPNEAARWDELLLALSDENPEDFLKVFWTSRYGLIQKSQIFRGVKAQYDTAEGVGRLLQELKQDAIILSALGDDDHPYWSGFAPEVRDQVFLLRLLDSKQARPLLISILRSATSQKFVLFAIRLVAVAIVRFQVIGKGRTGVVEKVFGRLCQIISSDHDIGADDFKKVISELITEDEAFFDAFKKHEDKKYSRIAYLLAADAAAKSASGPVNVHETRRYYDRCRIVQIFLPTDPADAEIASRIGNFHLISTENDDFNYPQIEIEVSDYGFSEFITKRSELLASRAVKLWSAEVDQ